MYKRFPEIPVCIKYLGIKTLQTLKRGASQKITNPVYQSCQEITGNYRGKKGQIVKR